jgi:regulator of sigma E protease
MGIYAMILYTWGDEYLKTENAKYGIECSELAEEVGFRNGDKIRTIDGVYYENFADIPEALILSGASEVIVDRKGAQASIDIPANLVELFIEKKEQTGFIGIAWPYIAQRFEKGSVAQSAGVKEGDQLIALNGEEALYFSDYIRRLPTMANQEITLTVLRRLDTLNFTMNMGTTPKLGVYYVPPTELIEYDQREYGFIESFPAGTQMALDKLNSYVQQFKLILNPETGAWKGLGGFITMGKQFKPQWDWKHFWNFTAFLSIILAFMNILPIPALDGGHVMFLLGEIITGRKPSDKLLENAQVAGFIILMGLLLLANGNDVINLFN